MKKILKIAGIVVALLLIVMVSLPFLLKDKIVALVKEEANKSLNATLDFEKLDLSFFSHFPKASVQLDRFSISGQGDFSGDTLIVARRIDLAVNVMSLFGDNGLDVSYIVLDRPVIRALKQKDGRVNWDIMKPDTAMVEKDSASSAESSFRLKLQNVSINEGLISYVDDSSGVVFAAHDLNLDLSGDMSSKSTTLKCKLETKPLFLTVGGVSYLKDAKVEMDMNLAADLENYKFTFEKNQLTLNAIALNLDGWVALPAEGLDMDVRISSPQIGLKELLSLIPVVYQSNFEDLQTSGDLSFSAFAKGRMQGDNYPAFDVRLAVKNGTISYKKMPRSVDQVGLQASVIHPEGILDKTQINLENLSFLVAGNPFRASFTATTPISDLHFKALAVGKINLGQLKEIYPLGDSIRLNGLIDLNLDFSGRLSDVEKKQYQKMQGSGTFTVRNMELKVESLPDISVKNASATVTPNNMTLGELNMTIGKSDMQAKGNLTNYLPYLLKNEPLSGSLTLSSDYLDLNQLMGDDKAASKSAGTRGDTVVVKAPVVPKNLDLTLKATCKEMDYQNIKITGFNGTVKIADGQIRLAPVTFQAFGGNVQLNGLYSTAKNSLRPDVSMGVDIRGASFEQTFRQLDVVRRLIPLFAKTGGDYSVKLDLTTQLDSLMKPDLMSLSAKGMLESSHIELQNVEVFDQLALLLKNDQLKDIRANDLKIPFTIENGLVRTNPFDLKLGPVSLNLSGTTSLTQQIDYRARIKLPAGYLGGYVSEVDALIGGTFTKPKISLDTQELVKDVVKQAVTGKLSELTGLDSAASKEEQIAALRKQADDAGNKLVETARSEGEKLVEKTKNPFARLAAEKAADILVKEAEKQAEKLKAEAEAKIKEL